MIWQRLLIALIAHVGYDAGVRIVNALRAQFGDQAGGDQQSMPEFYDDPLAEQVRFERAVRVHDARRCGCHRRY